MDLLTIILVLACVAVLFLVASSIFAYWKFAVPAMRNAAPLTGEDRAICLRLVKEWKAYPFLCRSSVKKSACPCQPCSKLNEAKAKKGS